MVLDAKKVVSDLKEVLRNPKDDGHIDIEGIHGILGELDGKVYLKVAEEAYNQYLKNNDLDYRSVFGIAISYARDRGQEIQKSEWQDLSTAMQKASTAAHLEWNRLPQGAAAMKTMVFAILNRNLMSGVVAQLRQGLGTGTPSKAEKVGSGRAR